MICNFFYLLFYLTLQIEMAEAFRAEGKIYVVVFVVLLLLFSLFYYMFRIERKINKIEQKKE
tara:strand:+ start:223 stop:408 length:186 start_codon:yes stop_codon:yes gene_type:complete